MYRGLLAFLVLLLSCPHFGGAVAQPGPLLSVTHSAWDLNVTIEAEPTEQNTYPFRTCVFTPGDGSAGVAGCTIRYAYASPGVYNATLDVYDTMGRLSTTPLTFILPEEPRPRITREGLAIVATLESHPSVAHMRSIVWRWGDDTTSTGVRGSHIYAQEGVYDLEVEVDYGTGIPTVYRTSLIVPLPKLVVSVEPDGLMVRCAVTSEPPGLLRDFRWDFGDGRPATGPGGTRNYSKPGTYDIRVEAKDAWGWTYWTTHRVHVRPSGFNVTSEGLDVSTTATGIRNMTGLFLEWDWGDGSARSSGPNSFHRYSASGRYSIDLYVYDSTGLLTTVPGEVHVALETDVPPQEAGRAEGSVNQES